MSDRLAEIKKLHEALSRFEDVMFRRMVDKEAEGYTGWDDEDDVPLSDLFALLKSKVELCEQPNSEARHRQHVTDIGVIAAFIHYRLEVFGVDTTKGLHKA